MIYKIKNNTGSSKTWAGQTIAAGEYYSIPGELHTLWANDSTLLTAISDGDAVVNDGNEDITNTSEAVNYLVSVSFPIYTLLMTDAVGPDNTDWAVNKPAFLTSDTKKGSLSVRLFDDTQEEGVGFFREIPRGAENIVLELRSRAETSPSSDKAISPKLYSRTVPKDSAVENWSSGMTLDSITISSNGYWHYSYDTLSLSGLGLVPGRTMQFELTRDASNVSDTLEGDWVLFMIKLAFS